MATLEGIGKINATISSKEEKIQVLIKPTEKLKAIISLGGAPADTYKGVYEVIPTAHQDVVLNVKQKVMTENVTVKSIPIYKMTNTSGGTTVSIG